MRRWFPMVLILGALGFSSGAAEAARKPVILLLGDSTVADFPQDRPVRGWGQLLVKELPGCEVKNLAVSGASSKSFLKLPQWIKAQGIEADYWLIQFGHNDQPGKGERSTDPQTDYKENLRAMITMALLEIAPELHEK